MKRIRLTFILVILGCFAVVGCDQQGGTTLVDIPNEPEPASSESSGETPDQQEDQSVGDVTTEGPAAGLPPAPPPSPDAVVSARVRNESEVRADVTVRFISDESIVHLAFVRVLPETVTTVTSPKAANIIELSGIDELGRALGSTVLAFGVDFDETTPADYVISDPGNEDEGGGNENDNADSGGGENNAGNDNVVDEDPPPVEPEPSGPEPISVTLLEPESDMTLTLGSTFAARWTDGGGTPGTVVGLFLQPVGTTGSNEMIPVGPAVGAALDGINDQLIIVLQDLEPGLYEVVAQIDDGVSVATSVAPGRVEVVMDPGNAAPTLSIRSPSELFELEREDTLTIRWDDADPDDNATITFSLVGTDTKGFGVGAFPIGPALAEDPDGVRVDAVTVTVEHVLPGMYSLEGMIDDGELVGTARVDGVVRIVPAPQNDPPTLVLIEPAEVVTVDLGGSFLVLWRDTDENDDARISLLLDPDSHKEALDGDEILLVASLGEDQDGPGDQITLGVPAGTLPGSYHVVGIITDGIAEVLVRAPGGVDIADGGASDGGGKGGGGGSTSDWQIVMSQPAVDVSTRLGDFVTIRIDTAAVPEDAAARVYLTNEAFGGNVRTDVTPDDFTLDESHLLVLPESRAVLPNNAWPRSFRLEAQVAFGGDIITDEAPGDVWIRQEVEIISVAMVNYWCLDPGVPTMNDSGFIGLEITWRGGGFGGGEEVLDPIHFWLSADGAVPEDDQGDDRHRDMFDEERVAAESPGPMTNLTVIELTQAIGIEMMWDEEGEVWQPGITVEPGEYEVMAVVETDIFGRIVTPAARGNSVEVCFPLPFPYEVELP